MSSTFPSILSSYTDPLSIDRLNSPSHSGIETNQNSGLKQVEAVIGVEGASSVVGTFQYLVKSPASNGGGHVQTAVTGGTGQITFTKGDILVATSPSVLSKLAVGSNGRFLTADSTQAAGIGWAGGAPTVRVYGYSSSVITWSKPSVLSYIQVEMVGGGGGGGGTTTANTHSAGGAGAGYSRKVIIASGLNSTELIGAGVGGTAGDQTGGTGGTGGTAFFTSLLTASGGLGGTENASGGAGGTGASGDVNIVGGPGGSGNGLTGGASGTGGNSYFGGGAVGKSGNNPGATGGNFGGGGSGASSDAGADQAGGAGAPGVVIIYEY